MLGFLEANAKARVETKTKLKPNQSCILIGILKSNCDRGEKDSG